MEKTEEKIITSTPTVSDSGATDSLHHLFVYYIFMYYMYVQLR